MTYTLRATAPYSSPGNLFYANSINGNVLCFAANGNTKVAGLSNGLIIYSLDNGDNWAQGQIYGYNNLTVRTIVWTGDRFLAAGGRIYESLDGVTWTPRTAGGNTYYGIAYSPTLGIYVAVTGTAANPQIVSSTDLNVWTQRLNSAITTAGTAGTVKWTGTSFIVTFGVHSLFYRSTDGINWTPSTSAVERYGITYDGTKYIAFGGASAAAISTDGIDWSTNFHYLNNSGTKYLSVVYDSTFKFVGVNGSDNSVYRSNTGPDLAGTSALVTTGPGSQLNTIVSNSPGRYVVTGTNTAKAFSTDGVTWTASDDLTYIYGPTVVFLASRPAGATLRGVTVAGRTSSAVNPGIRYTTDGLIWKIGGKTLADLNWRVGDVPADVPFVAVANSGTSSTVSTDGATWSAASNGLPAALNWLPPVYISSVGRYVVAASQTTTAAYSTDGLTWTSRTTGVNNILTKGTASSSRAVFVASAGTATAVTTDGITWQVGTITARAWSCIATNGSIFVALVNNSSVVGRSTDGLTWTESAIFSSGAWSDITWDSVSGAFYAVSTNITAIGKSTDGITWEPLGIEASFPQYIDAFDGKIVAVHGTSNYAWMCRPNTNVFFSTRSTNTNSINAGVYANGKYYLYTAARSVEESTDGINWSITGDRLNFMPRLRYSQVVAFKNLILANNGYKLNQTPSSLSTQIPYSYNMGQDWGVVGLNTLSLGSQAMAANSNIVVRLGVNSAGSNPGATNSYSRSTNGLQWTTSATLPVSLMWMGVVWTGTEFFAVGTAASRAVTTSAIRSTDGITWTSVTVPSAAYSGVAYGNGVYVASVQATGSVYTRVTTVYRSTDGTTWTSATIPAGYWNSLKFINNKFILLSNNLLPSMWAYAHPGSNQHLQSTDGITWTTFTVQPAVSNTELRITDIDYNGSVFCAVTGSPNLPAKNEAYVSTDLVSWTKVTLPHVTRWTCINAIGTTFIALADNDGICITSTDGTNWTTATYSLPAPVNKAITDTNGNIWLVGQTEVVKQTGSTFTRIATQYGTGNISAITMMDSGTELLVGGDAQTITYKVEIPTGRIWYNRITPAASSYPFIETNTLVGFYGNTAFYFVNTGGGGPADLLLVKKDGWYTYVDLPTGGQGNTVVAKNLIDYDTATGKFWMRRTHGNSSYLPTSKIVSSTDGLTWVREYTEGTTNLSGYTLARFKGVLVAGSDSAAVAVSYSTDNITWTSTGFTAGLYNYAKNSDVLVLASANSVTNVGRTTDGITWTTPATNALAATKYTAITRTYIYWHSPTSKFYLFAEGSDLVSSSTDGVTWSTGTTTPYPRISPGVFMDSSNNFVTFAYSQTLGKGAKFSSTDSITWTATECINYVPTNNTFYDNQHYISVPYHSTDGITWDYQSTNTGDACRDLRKIGSVYVKVDGALNNTTGGLWWSTTGAYWKRATPFSVQYNSFSINGSNIDAANFTNGMSSVDDGVTWQFLDKLPPPGNSGAANGANSIEYIDGKINYITGNTASTYYTSTDNRAWNTVRLYSTLTASNILKHSTMGNRTLVIASTYNGSSTGRTVAVSTDGNWWEHPSTTCLLSNMSPASCSNNGSVFTIVTIEGFAFNSTDGVNWTEPVKINTGTVLAGTFSPQLGVFPISDMIWDGSKYIVLMGASRVISSDTISTNTYSTSTDGINWIARPNLTGSTSWRRIAANGNILVAVCNFSNTVARSTDGISWTAISMGGPSMFSYPIIAYGNGKFVVFDEISQPSHSFAYVSSDNGLTWSAITAPSYDFGGNSSGSAAVQWLDDRFVASGVRNSNSLYVDVLQSTDGITWTENNVAGSMTSFTNGGTYIFKTGDTYRMQAGNTLLFSKNLKDWYTPAESTPTLYSISKFGTDTFYGAGSGTLFKNSTVEISSGATNFTEVTYG